MKKYPILILSLLFVFPLQSKLFSQSLPIDASRFDDYYRQAQLLGEADMDHSFVIRPLYPLNIQNVEDVYDPDYQLRKESFHKYKSEYSFLDKGKFKLLPLKYLMQFNSHHPEGINDGAMIPAKGVQQYVSLGFYAEYGPLSIQFQPEFVNASNPSFEGYRPLYINPIGLMFPHSPYGNIDYPERFGDDSYSKFFLGQSSIRLTLGAVSFGVSSENLWWGPGIRNSLLMTNTAPGFLHFTFNTVKPLKTPIGSFEWQLISGRLEDSGYTIGLIDDWRYINATILSYQPKWVPGLFLGVIRSFTVYGDDLGSGLTDYLPVITSFGKDSAGGDVEDAKGRNQIASVFFRWVWPKVQAEIYAEYGRNDHAWNLRDLFVQTSHTAAYNLGFRKIFTLNKNSNTYVQLLAELTQLEANPITMNRNGGSWYEHGTVKHGYTHYGQILGAGIGPGSNLQTLDVSWHQSLKSIGLRLERFVHNNDFYQKYVQDIRENWVDLSATVYGQWDYKNLLFNVKMKFVSSLNYQWIYYPKLGDESYFWEGDGWDVFNFHAQFGITYRF